MSSYPEFASSKWPFIGLRPFQYGDHRYFFGRKEELDELKPQVTQKHFVAIVGGSGSGKSSLISAGLRPRLEEAQDHRWNWIEMHPADAPVRNLALALAVLTDKIGLTGKAGDLTEAWADRFERVLNKSKLGIAEALRLIPQQSNVGRVLLLVDQFEELFRFAKLRSEESLDPATAAERWDEATAFVRLLLAATKSLEVPIHVVVTMRSDFIGDCALFHGLPEAVSQSQFLVPGMTRDQREDVIREPVRLAKGQIDPTVVQRALNDTNDEPDQLPILQHAMMRCWERAFRRAEQEVDHLPHLTIDDYKTIGGVKRALSIHANEILEETGLQLATKRVFQALTETDKEGRSVRRPQRLHDLVQYVTPGDASEDAIKEATRAVVTRFARHDCSFLRVIPPADIVDDSIIDIGHEALIRRWDRLEGAGDENWIHEEERNAEQYRALLRYADRGAIIPPEDLTVLESWWSERKPSRFWAQRYAKHKADNFEKIREVLAQSRAKADAAIEEHERYESRVIGLLANAIRNPRRYNGAADSLAMALNKPPHLPNVAEYVEVFYDGLDELREKRRIAIPDAFRKQVFAVSFAPTGRLLAAVVPDNLLFYDTDNGELVHSERIKSGWVLSLRWSPDGKRIYVGTSPVGLIVPAWSIQKLRKYFPDCDDHKSVDVGCEEHPAGYGAWIRDSNWILVAGWQRRASLWDASKGQFKGELYDDSLEGNPLDYLSSDLAISADGERIAVGVASGRIHIFNARSMGQDGPSLELEKSLDTIDKKGKPLPYSLVFDPRNHDRLLAAYMLNPYMALWKIEENVFSLFGDEESGPVWRVAFDPKGEFVASATNDTVVRLWTGDSAAQLRGHLTSVFSVDISPKDGNVASGSFDGTIRLWAKDSPFSPKLLSDSASMPAPDEFSVQNSQISVTANGGKKCSRTLPQNFGEASAAAVSANGAGVAVVPRSGRPVLLVDLRDSLTPLSVTLSGIKAEWAAVAFIENDTRIAAKTKEGKIFAWPFYSDVRSLEQLARQHLPVVGNENGVEKRLEVPGNFLRREPS
jgi:WD40 repeat protein